MSLNSNEKKKVLVFTHAGGNSELGPNARWSRFSNGLAKHNVEVSVIGASYFHKYRKTIRARLFRPSRSKVDEVSFLHVWAPVYKGGIMRLINQFVFSISLFFLRRSDFDRQAFDVVIASSPHPFVVFGAYFWARRMNAKFVFESRDLWPRLLVEHSGLSTFHPYTILAAFSERFAVSSCDCIFTPKELEKEYYKEKYAFNESHWIPNTSPSNNTTLPKSGHSKSKLHILYSGSLQSIYLVDELILAISRAEAANVILNVVGDGPMLESLKSLAAGDERVIFSGWLQGAEYSSALDSCDVCFFGTADMSINQYGFSSNKISDYLSRSKPILAHASLGVGSLVSSGSALQSNQGDVLALSNNIQRLIENPDLLLSMSRSASNYYREVYDFDTVVENLSKLLLS